MEVFLGVIICLVWSYFEYGHWTVDSSHKMPYVEWGVRHLGPSKEPVILHEIEMTLYDATIKASDYKNLIVMLELELNSSFSSSISLPCCNIMLSLFLTILTDRQGPGSQLNNSAT